MSQSKLVTIMIPTYNQPQYIEQCVDSVLSQDYANLEVVISDDSTNDDTENIYMAKYSNDSRVKYFHNTIRLGRVGNYHHTLYKKAKGTYALNLDGDDWLIDSSYISNAVSLLEEDAEVMCVIAKTIWYYENEDKYMRNEWPGKHSSKMKGTEYFKLQAKGIVRFNHMTCLYRREQAMQVGFYTCNTVWSDAESIFKLICQNKIGIINNYVGVWRIHSENESQTFYRNIKMTDLFLFEENVAEYCLENVGNNLFISKWKHRLMFQHTQAYLVYLLKSKESNKIKILLKYLWSSHRKFLFFSLPELLITIGYRAMIFNFRKIKVWSL